MRKLPIWLLFWVAGVAWAGPSSWEDKLFGRDLTGDGIADAYYDAMQNITWLKDANYAYNSGYPAANVPYDPSIYGWRLGGMSWADAMTWAGSLDLGGVTGWRLSSGTFRVSSTGDVCDLWLCTLGSSEMSTLYGELGGDVGPFVNIQAYPYYFAIHSGPAAGFGEYSADPGSLVREIGIPDGGAWGVHDGDVGVAVPVPEPSTYALMMLGLGVIGFAVRSRRIPK